MRLICVSIIAMAGGWVSSAVERAENHLDEDHEEVFGFSAPETSVRGGITVHF